MSEINMNNIERIPTAWDYFFSKRIGCHITVTLINGKTISGLYNCDSYVSEYPETGDIYLEKVGSYIGNYREDSFGVWIPRRSILYMEFDDIKNE